MLVHQLPLATDVTCQEQHIRVGCQGVGDARSRSCSCPFSCTTLLDLQVFCIVDDNHNSHLVWTCHTYCEIIHTQSLSSVHLITERQPQLPLMQPKLGTSHLILSQLFH